MQIVKKSTKKNEQKFSTPIFAYVNYFILTVAARFEMWWELLIFYRVRHVDCATFRARTQWIKIVIAGAAVTSIGSNRKTLRSVTRHKKLLSFALFAHFNFYYIDALLCHTCRRAILIVARFPASRHTYRYCAVAPHCSDAFAPQRCIRRRRNRYTSRRGPCRRAILTLFQYPNNSSVGSTRSQLFNVDVIYI